MSRVIVYVSGGVVQEVISNHEGTEVMVVDYDNEKTDGVREREFVQARYDPIYFERTIAGIED